LTVRFAPDITAMRRLVAVARRSQPADLVITSGALLDVCGLMGHATPLQIDQVIGVLNAPLHPSGARAVASSCARSGSG